MSACALMGRTWPLRIQLAGSCGSVVPDCNHDNASLSCSGNTASLGAYCYSPIVYPNTADTPNQLQAVPSGLLVPSQVLGGALDTSPPGWPGWYGFEFTVGAAPITVTQLGRWDRPGNNQSHTVMLTDQSGTELTDQYGNKAEVTVQASGSGRYVYATKTWILSANTTYALLSHEGTGDSWYDYNGTSITPSCVASGAVAVYSLGQQPPLLDLTTLGSGNQSYGPVNLIFYK